MSNSASKTPYSFLVLQWQCTVAFWYIWGIAHICLIYSNCNNVVVIIPPMNCFMSVMTAFCFDDDRRLPAMTRMRQAVVKKKIAKPKQLAPASNHTLADALWLPSVENKACGLVLLTLQGGRRRGQGTLTMKSKKMHRGIPDLQ